jgi:hypothetical protein
MERTAMLALQFDLNSYTSFWTATAAAEIFWGIFAIAVVLSIIFLRPRRTEAHRTRRRTRIYDLPPPEPYRNPIPPAERFVRRGTTPADPESPNVIR